MSVAAHASQQETTRPLSFEAAAIAPTPPDWRGGRFLRMHGARQFVATPL
jgi:hypothetical protein